MAPDEGGGQEECEGHTPASKTRGPRKRAFSVGTPSSLGIQSDVSLAEARIIKELERSERWWRQ